MIESTPAARYVQSAAWRLARRPAVRRWVHSIVLGRSSTSECVALVAVLLVEMSARRRAVRALEWAVALPLRKFPCPAVRRAGMKITTGPFQMSGGPWSREEAVSAARERLHRCGLAEHSIPDLARCWNGNLFAEMAGPLDYANALSITWPEAARLVAKEIAGWGHGAQHRLFT